MGEDSESPPVAVETFLSASYFQTILLNSPNGGRKQIGPREPSLSLRKPSSPPGGRQEALGGMCPPPPPGPQGCQARGRGGGANGGCLGSPVSRNKDSAHCEPFREKHRPQHLTGVRVSLPSRSPGAPYRFNRCRLCPSEAFPPSPRGLQLPCAQSPPASSIMI